MKRRDALKRLGALGLLATAIPSFANEKENEKFCDVYTKYKPIIKNRNWMKIKDLKHPTKGELKHTPDIKIGEINQKGFTKIEVTLGKNGIIHPSTKQHYIDFIELYADNELVGKTVFEPGEAMGYVSYNVKLNDAKTIKAVAGCNIHGIWENTISV